MANENTLEERLSQLEEKHQLLEARLEAEKTLRRKTMRDSLLCPSCGGQKIYHIKKLPTTAAGAKGSMIYRNYLYTTFRGVWNPEILGLVQAFTCAACGHSEFQMENIPELEQEDHVDLLTREERNEGPYR